VSPDRATVLIAEDSMLLRALLRTQLEERGYRVLEAVDGETAMQIAREELPDAILLDVEMTPVDGFTVLAELKADAELADTPVVVISGRTASEDAVHGLDLGAHDYLRKPFEPDELAARVHAAVRVKRLQDELKALNSELTRLASTDQLTGSANRRRLNDEMERNCSRSARHGTPLALLMLDADHFKSINDQLGHQAGDEALIGLVGRLRQRLRREDLLGRWGGEEFMVVAPDTDAAGAAALAEALREQVGGRPIHAGGQDIPLTISVGYTTWDGDQPADLVRRADRALYEAKNAGRNRTVQG
jgi:diguanylate cyclase (GGDEF)-like protein